MPACCASFREGQSSNPHSAITRIVHVAPSRGFLPRGLSDSCPLSTARTDGAAAGGRNLTTLNRSRHSSRGRKCFGIRNSAPSPPARSPAEMVPLWFEERFVDTKRNILMQPPRPTGCVANGISGTFSCDARTPRSRSSLLAFIRPGDHAGVQRKPGHLAHRLREGLFWIAGRQGLQREHFAPRPRPNGDAVRDRGTQELIDRVSSQPAEAAAAVVR